MMARMISRTGLITICLAIAPLIGIRSEAQSKSPADRLYVARALYYTPTAQGLKSFHCDLAIDWKDLLSRFSGADIKDDNPFLKYLQTAHLSVSDELKGKGQLEWANTGAPHADKEDAAAKMKQGMQEMISGFFTSWNGYMNGTMVPAPDSTTTLSETAAGLHLHAETPGTDLNEQFDKDMLLTEAHVVQPVMDATAYPIYIDTPDGRVISVIRTVFRQPPTAPPAELSLQIAYTKVSSFRLPETLQYDLKNVAAFVFKFSGCTVQTAEKAPEKL
jgi:hypothetical protein